MEQWNKMEHVWNTFWNILKKSFKNLLKKWNNGTNDYNYLIINRL